MAKGLRELEHLLLNSAESWRSRDNTYGDSTYGDSVMGSFDMFCTTGSAALSSVMVQASLAQFVLSVDAMVLESTMVPT